MSEHETGGTFRLSIKMETAAFDGPMGEIVEVTRILSKLVNHLRGSCEDSLDYVHSRRLMDANGNTVGNVEVIR